MNRMLQYLEDLQEQIENIESFTANGKDEFFENKLVQYAVMRCYEIIGEIVKRIPEEILERYPQVEWKEVKGLRDFLIHRYPDVKLDPIWRAVSKISELKAAVEAMMQNLTDNDSDIDPAD
jgi:uncharacterized protein with HEPN domain